MQALLSIAPSEIAQRCNIRRAGVGVVTMRLPPHPRTQTAPAPPSPRLKPAGCHTTSAPRTQKNETPRARRTDPLPQGNQRGAPHRIRAPQTTGPVSLYRRKSALPARQRQSSSGPTPASASPKPEISAQAQYPSSASRDTPAHPQETDRQMRLLQSPRQLPSRKPAPSALHIAHSNTATAKAPPTAATWQPQPAAPPTHAAPHASPPGLPLR